MNLRIEGQTLRFRISKEELETLCLGGALQQIIPLPDLRMEILVTTESSDAPLKLHIEKNRWHLQVNKETAQTMLASLPNREGILHRQKVGDTWLCLMLEVDIRTQKRKR